MVAEVANVLFRIDKPVDDGAETALLRNPRPVLQAVSVRLAREDMAIEPGHRALVRLRFSRLRPAEALHVFVRFRDPANYLANRELSVRNLSLPRLRARVSAALERVSVHLGHHTVGVGGARLLSRCNR